MREYKNPPKEKRMKLNNERDFTGSVSGDDTKDSSNLGSACFSINKQAAAITLKANSRKIAGKSPC